MDATRASLESSKLLEEFRDEAVRCVVYTRNLSPTAALKKDQVPAKPWYNTQNSPSIGHLRTFGEYCIFWTDPNMREDGTIYKARLIVQGNTQIKDLDYTDVSAPVFRLESFRVFLSTIADRCI